MGAGFLLAYYLLMIEIALATHAVGTFRISFWKFGPTELRILLAIGTLQLLQSGTVTIAGSSYLLFDVGGAVAIVGLADHLRRLGGRQHADPVSRRAAAGAFTRDAGSRRPRRLQGSERADRRSARGQGHGA